MTYGIAGFYTTYANSAFRVYKKCGQAEIPFWNLTNTLPYLIFNREEMNNDANWIYTIIDQGQKAHANTSMGKGKPTTSRANVFSSLMRCTPITRVSHRLCSQDL